MPNFLENLRLKNLFGLPEGGMVGENPYKYRTPPFVPEGKGLFGGGMEMQAPMGGDIDIQTPPGPVGGGMNDIASRMSKMYTPESEATDRFNQLIEGMPQRNKPGMLRKIASIAAGTLGGPEAFDRSMYGNYNNKMKDWKEQLDPAYKSATLERQSNVNERTLAMQTISAELREQAQQHKEANDTKRAEIAQQRADVYEYKAKNPNLQFNFTGPTVKVSDPQTGKVADTGIPTGNISDADKLALQQGQALERISATGEERRTTQAEGHEQDMDEIIARGEQARRTRATPSGGTGKDELPTQTRVRQFNAARELANTRPELKKFIKLGSPGSNDFTVTPPGQGFFGPTGPTKEQYEEIQGAIYSGAMSKQTGRGAQTIYKTQRNTRTGATRRVMSTDGGKTWKPAPAGK
jgi:hypothetical protein